MEKAKRSKSLEGQTVRVKTGCGNLYITVNGSPTEVFAHLGKAGGCAACQNEALTRVITLGLKFGIPVSEFVDELKGLQCPEPNLYPEDDRILSCPDGIGKILEEVTSDTE